MKSLRAFFQGNRKYARVEYTTDSAKYLRRYCLTNGIDIKTNFDGTPIESDSFVFHTTIFYTSNRIKKSIPPYLALRPVPVKPIGFDVFGENKNCLVLKLESAPLHKMYEYFADEYGMKSDYPVYKPHITLSYAYDGRPPESLDLPTFSLKYDKVLVSDVDT